MAPPSRDYIYGINPAFEVVRAGRRKIYQAFLNQATRNQPRLAKLARFLEQADISIDWVDKHRLFELSRSKEHQGAVLKTSTYPYVAFDDLLAAPRLLLLDNVEDPTNVGALLRSAEIFGFQAVCLPTKGTPDIYPSVVKVSAGASEHLTVCRDHTANRYVNRALDEGFQLVALDGKGTVDLADLPIQPEARWMLVIGGEDKSVGQYILNAATHIARIGMAGRINSLNASVAAGIAMYEINQALTKRIP
jgi:23S rRNA (guanosine2251-2'-O)-methyltransferase